MKNANAGHRERLRQRYLSEGLDSFQDHEVLELLLFQYLPYKDTNKIAHKLLEEFGSLYGVLDASPEQLVRVAGISTVTAVNLSLLKDVWFRYQKSAAEAKRLTTLSDIVSYAQTLLSGGNYEKLLVVYVDASTKFIGKKFYCTNDNMAVNIPIKQLVSDAMLHSASGVMLFHSHVKGIAKPSDADLKYTEQLYFTFANLGVALLEHGIFNSDGVYYSFIQNGHIKKFSENYNKFNNR
ncbi:MAG: hypothetical protein NC350_04910 [Corallococcus sp.]|nr:hypothetical protein [Corallococcus sp.]